MNHRDEFRESVERDAARQKKAEHQKSGLFGLFFYGGVLGLLLVLPMIGGAYLGRWLDSLSDTYETRWTVSLIILGVVCGLWNVYWYLREHL